MEEDVLSGAVGELDYIFLFQLVISLRLNFSIVQEGSVGGAEVDDVRQDSATKLLNTKFIKTSFLRSEWSRVPTIR